MNKKELEEHRRLLLELCKDYKQRIDKAIEYIGNYEEYCDEKECYCTPKYFEHLLDILGDKENE